MRRIALAAAALAALLVLWADRTPDRDARDRTAPTTDRAKRIASPAEPDEGTPPEPEPKPESKRCTVEGWVRLADGTPLARRPLELRGWRTLRTETDAAGNFRFVAERPGPRGLVLCGAHGYEMRVGSVSLVAGETVRREVEIAPGHTLSGTVVGPGGPVEGATVSMTIAYPGGGSAPTSVRTDAEGRFALPFLQPATYRGQITAPGHEAKALRIRVEEDQTAAVRLARARSLEIRLSRVPDETRGSRVRWMLRGSGWGTPGNVAWMDLLALGGTVSLDTASFVIDAPPPGEYRFTLVAQEGLQVSTTVTIGPGALAPVSLEIPDGARVEGTLRDRDGGPVTRTFVWLATAHARTDEEGRFTFGFVAAGRRRLLLPTHAGRVPVAEIEVPARGSITVDVVATGLAAVSGRVPADARVELWTEGGNRARKRDAGGGFRFAHLPPGRYVLRARAPDRAADVAVTLAADAEQDLGAIALATLPTLPVAVTVPPGAALPTALTVEVRGDEGALVHGATVALDADGNGTIRGLPAGAHAATIGAPGFMPIQRLLVVEAGATAPLPLALEND